MLSRMPGGFLLTRLAHALTITVGRQEFAEVLDVSRCVCKRHC